MISPPVPPVRRWRRRVSIALVGTALAWLCLRSGLLAPTAPDQLLRQRFGVTRLLDREGRTLQVWTGPEGVRHRPLTLQTVSPRLIAATLAAEDHRFWSHPGIDPLAIGRATWQNMRRARVVSGASTLTQQLCKWLEPRPRTLWNKAVEAVVALHLEARLDKRTILTLYLSYAPYGGLQRGAEQAARAWLGKSATDLSWAEAAWLAVLPRSPARLDPQRDPSAALPAQRALLKTLHADGTITAAELQTALAQPIRIPRDPRPYHAPHLAQWLHDRWPQLVGERPRALQTTIDGALQDHIEALARRHVLNLRARRVGNAAVVVLDNERGEVLALVGSVGYSDRDRQGANNGALALRQPGSTIKPFTYAAAFTAGLSPATLLADLPSQFDTPTGAWLPQNYGHIHHGPVRARTALASSLNLPAVRLLERIGTDRLRDLLAAAGFDSLGRMTSHYGLALTLGDGEVTLLELTAAFQMFAREGVYRAPRVIDAVVAWDGHRQAAPAPAPRRLLSPEVAWQVADILRDPNARSLAFGRGGPLEMPFAMLAKTGTSKGFRDNWAIGATTRYTVGVWAGNFDGTPMHDVSGVSGAAPLLRDVMLHLHRHADPPVAPRPTALRSVAVCPLSGGAWKPDCGPAVTDWLAPHQHLDPCDWHRRVAIDPLNGLLAGSDCPPPVVWRDVIQPSSEFAAWAARHLPSPPAGDSPRCQVPRSDSAARVQIVTPHPHGRYVIDVRLPPTHQQLGLRALCNLPQTRLLWRIDGEPLGPPVISTEAVAWTPRRGRHQAVVEAVSAGGEVVARDSVTFDVDQPQPVGDAGGVGEGQGAVPSGQSP